MINKNKIEEAVKLILEAIGDDPNRDGLLDTPKRVAKAYEEMFEGYYKSNEEILAKTFDDIKTNNSTITIENIPIYSFCEHHMLPFFGTASVSYTVRKGSTIVGLSKINRLVQNISRKLQTQERITYEIGKAIFDNLKPLRVEVKLKCRHMCVEMRGIRHSGSETNTIEIFDINNEHF